MFFIILYCQQMLVWNQFPFLIWPPWGVSENTPARLKYSFRFVVRPSPGNFDFSTQSNRNGNFHHGWARHKMRHLFVQPLLRHTLHALLHASKPEQVQKAAAPACCYCCLLWLWNPILDNVASSIKCWVIGSEKYCTHNHWGPVSIKLSRMLPIK